MYDSEKHYAALYRRVRPEFGFKARTRPAWERWRDAFRPRLRQALGLDAMAADLAGYEPRARMSGEEDLGDYVRESWHLWVEPQVPLPFCFLRPKNREGPRPLVLTPHGHNPPHIYLGIYTSDAEKTSIEEGDRDIAVQAVREGYTVIAPTARAFGETRAKRMTDENAVQSCRDNLVRGLLVGRTVIGERVWDISRLIDWALGRDEVDGSRIAITGNSGGGTISVFAPACETRITVAVPSCYFCTFVGSIGMIHHCDCNYVPGILRLGEMHDVAGLVAPRAFCAIAGRDDPIFPIHHVRTAFERLKQVYEVAGVPERCALYVGDGGHRYYKAGAWPFVRNHFGDKTGR